MRISTCPTIPITEKSTFSVQWKKTFFVLFFLMSSTIAVFGSHFRYGVMTATRLSETPTTVTYQVTLSTSWNLAWNFGTTTPSHSIVRSGGNTGSFLVTGPLVLDPSGQWRNHIATATVVLNKSATPTRLSFASNAKISTISNNANQPWDVYCILNTNAPGNPPVSNMPAIINMPIGAPAATYSVPVSDPDAGTTFTFATPAFTGSLINSSNPTGFSISPAGVITFNTVGKSIGQQYNAMITVKDNDGNTIFLDFLINMVGPSNPPAFDYSVTPANGAEFNVIAGQTLSFGIRATDPDVNSTVSLSVAGLNSAISLANFSANPLPATGNPAVTSFSYTPNGAAIGSATVLNFSATDNVGVQSSTSVTIKVVAEPAPVFVAPTPVLNSARQILTGVLHQDQIVASSSLGSNVSIAFATIPNGATLSPAIPTTGANLATTTLSWTPTPANWGLHNLNFQAVISNLPSIFTQHNYQIEVNTPPVFASTPPTSLTVMAGQPFTYNIVATDPDIPFGDHLDIVAATKPAWLTLTQTSPTTAVLTGTPTAANAGSNTVHLELEDIYHHGNPSHVEQEFTITVIAGVAPSIVVPTNIVSCDPVVNFAATETVGIPSSTITYSIAPGSIFPIGTTTVVATATNTLGTSTKTFTVTVSKPIADIAVNGATTICEGANVPLNAAPYALRFNGSQHVNVPNGFATTNDITIEATITPTVLADGTFKVLMNHNSWYTGTIHFQFFPDGRLQFAINGANPVDQYCTFNFVPNTTYRIAVVYSRFGNYVKFYVNGVLINTGLYFGSVPVVGNASYSIGSWNGNERFFSGTIDDFRIWNVQRTDAQVLSDAAALPIPSGTPNLIRYYKFNEGTGTSTADAAGNGTGALVNNPTWVSTASAGQTYLWSNGAITPSIAATVDGPYTVTVTDAAGCSATSAPVNITVNKAPVFTSCPSNQTANNASGFNSAIVTYNATVTSTPTATLSYTFSGATTGSGVGTGSGESFNIGTTTVTITATNTCSTATCTFTVTVLDIQPPVISNPPANIIVTCESIPTQIALNVSDFSAITSSLMYESMGSGMKTDLVHEFNFENNANDSKGAVTGANVGSITFVPGISGNALSFNGNLNQYVNFGTSASLNGTINFGLSVWVKTSSGSPMTVIQQRDGQYNGQYILNIGSDHNGGNQFPGKVYFMVYNNAFQFELVSSVRVDDGKWHHIIAERQGTNGRVFVDGNLVASGSGPLLPLNGTIGSYVGKDYRDNSKPFIGLIDQLKIYAGGSTPKTYDLERTWSYTDASGNTSMAQQIVTVQDNTPPVIGTSTIVTPTQADGSVIATSAAGAIVNYTLPTATDNCSSNVIVTSLPASGSTFPIGTTIVTFTAIDEVGNIATSTMNITVKGIAPSIVVPATITVASPANACGAVVNFAATETTAIPASTLTYSHQPGSTFPVGTTVVTATATNAVGTSVGTFEVTVKDVTAPIIGATINLNAIATSANGAVVNYTLPTATDNCGGQVTIVATPVSGSVFPIGTTTVTVLATDQYNNSSSTTFTVTVVGVPPVIVVPATIRVDASASNCGAVVNFAATETTAIPASTITYSHQPGSTFPLGTTVVTATATNAVGTSVGTFEIIVTDNTAPVINLPAAPVFCENTSGLYTLPVVSASDNCGVATVSYAITGVTQRNGTGFDAGTAFNVGASTITYTVTDVNGNVTVKSIVVTVNKAPTTTIAASNPDAFCNKLVLVSNSTSAISSYAWSYNNASFASTQAVSLDNTNGDGTYSLYVTDNKGCTSLTAVSYQYSKQNTISNYTILAYKEAELKEYNTVQTGSVGVMSKKGKAEIGKNSSVAAPGAFVKAPKIEVKQGANVPVRLIGVATVSLPTMQYNTSNTNNLPNYTTNQGATISLSGNYKNLKIRKGSNVTLSGNTYGNIEIEEGSVVRFTSTVINVEHLKVGKGPNNGLTQVRFADNTSIRVAKHVTIEEDCFINPDGNKVTFYLGKQSNHDCNKHRNGHGEGHDNDDDDRDDDDHDRGHGDGDQKFEVKGGNTTVIANVYAPTGDIKVKGGEGCHKNHSSTVVKMTGLFIGYEVEGDGRNIIWNSYACGTAAPIAAADAQPVYNKTAEDVVVADDLKVTVMPNPSTTYFTLKLVSKSELPVNIKVVDAAGRLVDAKAKQAANSTLQLGQNYATGNYFVEFIQGNQRKVVQLIKIK
ncbi:LamG-like jellyroll fold domain-containing protein [Sediminibacterium sp.]|uniref:LamG-like jellyroll fold domain-containing protein n=1 Tax=Sediminibacterium sp. TaxID=1917865 RepID=UPI0027356BE4|nr:LamG-like jellyroll fold domain-containing protein [Sediminibacterium sp.]MDP3392963.1 LamG-like jellyroll fold domain-containing protein [Sediminibacterium sp.]MDP3567169.1 LamG-like jellyroll fold domain-containing protein [Sediminibacterium sp.]